MRSRFVREIHGHEDFRALLDSILRPRDARIVLSEIPRLHVWRGEK